MVIKLSRHAIKQWCSPQAYQKGERLSNSGKVQFLRYDADEGVYIAEVFGHERNQVQVHEGAQGAPIARCTCPSLGKTVQSIAFLSSVIPDIRKRRTPALIISPGSIIYNWQQELRKFAPDIRVLIADGDPR